MRKIVTEPDVGVTAVPVVLSGKICVLTLVDANKNCNVSPELKLFKNVFDCVVVTLAAEKPHAISVPGISVVPFFLAVNWVVFAPAPVRSET